MTKEKTKGAATMAVENIAAEMPSLPDHDAMDACVSMRDLGPLVNVIDSAHRTGENATALIVDLQHVVIGAQHDVADMRAEVAEIRAAQRTTPRWRTVAADALDSLAAMLRGSW